MAPKLCPGLATQAPRTARQRTLAKPTLPREHRPQMRELEAAWLGKWAGMHRAGSLPVVKADAVGATFAEVQRFSRSYAEAYGCSRNDGESRVEPEAPPGPAPTESSLPIPPSRVAPSGVELDDTMPGPLPVDPAWFRPAGPAPSPAAPPAVDVDTTLGLGTKVVVGTALPFQQTRPWAPPVLPALTPVAARVDTGTLWLDRGAPAEPAPSSPQPAPPARPTVALSGFAGANAPNVPFTLAPSRAPLAPSTPFRPLSIDEFARVVVTLERGWDPTALLDASGLTMRDWAAISRDMFRRSLGDALFARELESALDRARRGGP